eukprot:COSAG02_NODE_1930_length_10329_cov_16.764125_2_plen_184_part_00
MLPTISSLLVHNRSMKVEKNPNHTFSFRGGHNWRRLTPLALGTRGRSVWWPVQRQHAVTVAFRKYFWWQIFTDRGNQFVTESAHDCIFSSELDLTRRIASHAWASAEPRQLRIPNAFASATICASLSAAMGRIALTKRLRTLNTRRKRLAHHKSIFYAPKNPASPNSTPQGLPTGFLGRFANF